ncbi:hypothetical protein [Sulfurovum sp.]|uniref:hypothetical protein n=1 Tax=Sulfurovum sp. TaxID=1969726 RepID=UPI0035690963
MNKTIKWWEYTCLILGYGVLITFFLFSICQNDGTWFARAGSIGVIFGAILEYNFSHQQQLLNKEIGQKLGVWVDNPIDYSDTSNQKLIKIFTHILLVVSTIIWGYGDLIFY